MTELMGQQSYWPKRWTPIRIGILNERGPNLALVGSHANLITAAMFLTGMAANPMVAKTANAVFGVTFDWGTWALGSLVPGLVGLALLPVFIFFLAKPTLTDTREAQAVAQRELEEMGRWSRGEKIVSHCQLKQTAFTDYA